MNDSPSGVFAAGRHVHFLGIGGIGMSALAQWLRLLDIRVSGSDRADSDVLDMLRAQGIDVRVEERATLPQGTDVLVYSDAVPPEDGAREEAVARSVPQYSYAKALGMLASSKDVVAISGSHGKSTTTAMAALLLTRGEQDPTVVIGTKVPAFDGKNFRAGKGNLFVVEADEYREHSLEFAPLVGVITTTDHDHVDAFPTLESYQDVYRKFADRIRRPSGRLILRASDALTEELRARTGVERAVTFDLVSDTTNTRGLDWAATAPVVRDGRMEFQVFRRGEHLGMWTIPLPGDHLVLDALAALAAVEPWNIPLDILQNTLAEFSGTWRRFERVGTINGAEIISDYGHHPTELRALFSAAQQWYHDRRLVILFQPHQKIRTRAFHQEFLDVLGSLSAPHVLLLAEVYDVAGREEHGDATSSEAWIDPLRAQGVDARFVRTLADAEAAVRTTAKADDVVFVVGAGTIDSVARRLARQGTQERS